MSMTFAQGLTELNTILGDSADVTFTSSEKTRALTKAWRDTYVVNSVWDTSLSYTTGTYQYTFPATLTALEDIYISPTGATQPFPEPISSGLWDLVNGKIQFRSQANSTIPSGYVLYLKGRFKVTTSDSITNDVVAEYVLALAGVYTLKLLMHKKANLFTKNDTTVSELIGIKRELENDVVRLRQSLRTSWESV
jgi:hypothetical protein